MKKRTFPPIRWLSVIPPILFTATLCFILTGMYRCPFYTLFHIPCAGCGMTRAIKAFLHFDLVAAFKHHCLFPIPILWAVFLPLRNRIRWGRRMETAFLAISVFLFVTRWITILFQI